LLALNISYACVVNFHEGQKAPTASEISHSLEIPIRLVHQIIFDLTEAGVLSEVKIGDSQAIAYQPARDIEDLTIQNVLDRLDRSGIDTIPIAQTKSLGIFKNNLDPRLHITYNVHMKELRFEWDERKEKANIKKHGVSFNDARTVFYDENAIQFFDPDHSEGEDRFILLGMSFKLRILVVCHCFRKSETVVRIFSARKVDGDEEQEYWRRRK